MKNAYVLILGLPILILALFFFWSFYKPYPIEKIKDMALLWNKEALKTGSIPYKSTYLEKIYIKIPELCKEDLEIIKTGKCPDNCNITEELGVIVVSRNVSGYPWTATHNISDEEDLRKCVFISATEIEITLMSLKIQDLILSSVNKTREKLISLNPSSDCSGVADILGLIVNQMLVVAEIGDFYAKLMKEINNISAGIGKRIESNKSISEIEILELVNNSFYKKYNSLLKEIHNEALVTNRIDISSEEIKKRYPNAIFCWDEIKERALKYHEEYHSS